MAYTDFYHWWNQNPTKWGMVIASQNKEEVGMTARQYFQMLFGKTSGGFESPFTYNLNDDYFVNPWFYDYHYTYEQGWRNDSYKNSLYIPMMFKMNKKFPNHFDPFVSLVAKYPKKIVALGNEPDLVDEHAGGSNTPVYRYVEALDILLTKSPKLQYIGPNCLLMDYSYRWLSAFKTYIDAVPARKPAIWGIHIYTNNGANHWEDLYGGFKNWLGQAGFGNDPIRVMETAYNGTGNIGKQIEIMTRASDVMKKDNQLGCVNWFVDYYTSALWDCALHNRAIDPWPMLSALGEEYMELFQSHKYRTPLNTTVDLPVTYGW